MSAVALRRGVRRDRLWRPAKARLTAVMVAAVALIDLAGVAASPRSGVDAAGHLLDLWNKQQLEYRGLPGLAIAVVHDQDVIWSNTYGWADVESRRPVTASTPFRIGSVTKLFTATAVMQLRDAGRLRLDDPVSEHLPWFAVEAEDAGVPITVRHLLTHTAGLTREAPLPYWTDHVFPDRDELVAALGDLDAVYPPATEYKYSNLGMALLGEIVAVVSGRSWEQYVEDEIFTPLGMDDSDTAPSDEVKSRLATGYMRRRADASRGIFDYYETNALSPAASITSTLDDLVRFAKLQFRDEPLGEATVLAGSTLREMQRLHWLSSWSGGRGLGFGVWERGGETMVSHGGWIAGNRTHLLLSPERKIAVVTLVNTDDGQPHVFGLEAYDTLATAIANEDTAQAAETAPGAAPPSWEAYVGRYSDPWEWEYRVFVADGDLVLYDYSYPPADSARAGVTILEPVEGSEHTFLMPDGESVVFEFDAEHRVHRMKRRFDYLQRLRPEEQVGEEAAE